jgi:hypothetical protein
VTQRSAALGTLLPIPSAEAPDLGAYLMRRLSESHRPQAHIVLGGHDSGKSALARTLADRSTLGDVTARLVDLSTTGLPEALDDGLDLLIVDHIDRIENHSQLQIAFAILDHRLPGLVSQHACSLLLTMDENWASHFSRIYRTSPSSLLESALIGRNLELHVLRPYSDEELEVLCGGHNLNAADFWPLELRRAGVLAMARSSAPHLPPLTGAQLREMLAIRWSEGGHDEPARRIRALLWRIMGKDLLETGSFARDLQSLYAVNEGRVATERLRAEVGGPVRWEGTAVGPDSPSWGDVAAAQVLGDAILHQGTVSPTAPIRTSVLDALIQIVDPAELESGLRRTLASFQGSSFTASGWLGPALGTLLARVTKSTEIAVTRVALQGPDHSELPSIPGDVSAIVEARLSESLSEALDGLTGSIQRAVASDTSAFNGGYACWRAVRSWASALQLRADAESSITDRLPRDGSWRYEDILDVSVTGASTRFMDENRERLVAALADGRSPVIEYLADVWDGINDGAWDQIDATPHEFASSFSLPPSESGRIRAVSSGFQRAHFGAHDAGQWIFRDCDLLLADFRSCANLETTDFDGSNWWSAILPPPVRYRKSRECVDEAFLSWCESPPWRNPYYTSEWPAPFLVL